MNATEPMDTCIRCQIADTDVLGIAYFGAYARWLEAARNDFFRGLGFDDRFLTGDNAARLSMVVAALSIEYRAPVRFGDVVSINLYDTSRLDRRTACLSFRVEISERNVHAADATMRVCWVDAAGRNQRPPEELLSLV